MNARPDDDRLMAYVDGELDAAGRAEVEAALAADPALARCVQAQQALRQRLREAYAPVLDEPMPERLLAAARGAPSNVVDLAAARGARPVPPPAVPARRRWQWPEWGAMAASVAAGFVAAQLWWPGREPFATAPDGALVAQGTLAHALGEQLASAPPGDSAVRIGTSFVARSGGYCRSFVLERGAPLAGLACRDGARWRLELVAPAVAGDAAAGGYRMAGSALPPALLAAIDARIQGPPLDAAAEKAARDKGWR